MCLYLYFPVQQAWHHVGQSECEKESRASRGNHVAPPYCPGNQPSGALPQGTSLRSGQEKSLAVPPAYVRNCDGVEGAVIETK